MSKVFSRSTSGLVAAPRLARRDFGLRLAAGALLAGSSFLGGKRAVAADGNAAIKDGLYARLRAASLARIIHQELADVVYSFEISYDFAVESQNPRIQRPHPP